MPSSQVTIHSTGGAQLDKSVGSEGILTNFDGGSCGPMPDGPGNGRISRFHPNVSKHPSGDRVIPAVGSLCMAVVLELAKESGLTGMAGR